MKKRNILIESTCSALIFWLSLESGTGFSIPSECLAPSSSSKTITAPSEEEALKFWRVKRLSDSELATVNEPYQKLLQTRQEIDALLEPFREAMRSSTDIRHAQSEFYEQSGLSMELREGKPFRLYLQGSENFVPDYNAKRMMEILSNHPLLKFLADKTDVAFWSKYFILFEEEDSHHRSTLESLKSFGSTTGHWNLDDPDFMQEVKGTCFKDISPDHVFLWIGPSNFGSGAIRYEPPSLEIVVELLGILKQYDPQIPDFEIADLENKKREVLTAFKSALLNSKAMPRAVRMQFRLGVASFLYGKGYKSTPFDSRTVAGIPSVDFFQKLEQFLEEREPAISDPFLSAALMDVLENQNPMPDRFAELVASGEVPSGAKVEVHFKHPVVMGTSSRVVIFLRLNADPLQSWFEGRDGQETLRLRKADVSYFTVVSTHPDELEDSVAQPGGKDRSS